MIITADAIWRMKSRRHHEIVDAMVLSVSSDDTGVVLTIPATNDLRLHGKYVLKIRLSRAELETIVRRLDEPI